MMSNKYFGVYVETEHKGDKIANLYASNPKHLLQILKEAGYNVDQLIYIEKCFGIETQKFPLFEDILSKFAYEVLCSSNISTIKAIIERNRDTLKQKAKHKTLFKSIYNFYENILAQKVTFEETKDRIMRHKLLLDCGLFGGDIMFKDIMTFVNLPDLTPTISIGP